MVNVKRNIIKELKKRKVVQHRADVNIGKRGLHPGVIEEIRRRLEIEGAVKIRILKNARSIVKDEDIRRMAESIGAIIADWRGYTYVLVKREISGIKVDKEVQRRGSG
ncbi:MAG TPA: RNA-binding protein [Ignisphaera sp.]|uniref:RNA-binding protein n=1 Tax=Ignisphaera aggregans TaxID=334771 RepID=A0A832Z480_9CREN|nr:RNA-binding protein [Ignisphaera sp.]HIP57518.1 RNA-binding protein [Ignisphaera aggregans]